MPDFGKLCQKVETIDVEVLISKIENVKVIYEDVKKTERNFRKRL